jgi:glycosyltransferase involved in cell wall biosynthesis
MERDAHHVAIGAQTTADSIRLFHITTIPMSLLFLRGQVGYMKEHGFDVQIISSPGEGLMEFGEREQVRVHAVPIERRISPLADLVTIFRLALLFRRERAQIVHGHTPKGALVSMIAAFLARVPIRVYHLRGLPLEGATALRRIVLWTTEWISCVLATRVIAVSHSLRQVALAYRFCPPQKIVVLAKGSGNGVDAEHLYHPMPDRVRAEVRRDYDIPATATVIGFVGRLVRDKGVAELSQAWRMISQSRDDAYLMIIGPVEERDRLPQELLEWLRSHDRIRFTGMQTDIARLYAAADVIALPTYREGFPNVALEAAAMGLPIVATRVTGCVDAVVHDQTGLLCAPRNPEALAASLLRYLDDPQLRQCHGDAARVRVLRDFQPKVIWTAIEQQYRSLLASWLPRART